MSVVDYNNNYNNQLLSYQEQSYIFRIIKICFKDVEYFDVLIAKPLQLYLAELRLNEVMLKSKKGPTEKYFDMEYYKRPEKRALFKFIILVFKCTNVLILLLKGIFQDLLWKSEDQLLDEYAEYPEFRKDNLAIQEQTFLLNFRNTMRVALEIIPAKANKQLLIDIAGRLEGSIGAGYITGGGETPCTHRRVLIYRKEGGVQPRPKAPKSCHGRSRESCLHHDYIPLTTAKAIKPTDEDIARASKRVRYDSDSHMLDSPSLNFPPNIFDEDDEHWLKSSITLSNDQEDSVSQLGETWWDLL